MTGAAYIPSAKREDWQTPDEVIALVKEFFGTGIGTDPCASPDPADHFAVFNFNPAVGTDGLEEAWDGNTFVNPPFGELREWAEKCADEGGSGSCEVVLLCPARTDTRAWHDHIASAAAVCLWRGRMTFKGAPAPAPFPVALSYWGPNHKRFREVFAPHGMVFRP